MDLTDRLVAHDLWLTERLLDRAAMLPPEELDRPVWREWERMPGSPAEECARDDHSHATESAQAEPGMTMNKDTKRMRPKFASVTRARLRTSEWDRTARRCRERPTKSRPTSVAAAVPAMM